ncbi:redoxin domain-containing protein [Cylindrospermopsis raciborskii CHAB3438]|uniref:thioredoxin-dependent peroxiredoxin n=2 Tax=Cylindrospermopsis raciborskii TaxID=77022 RepID=A0A853MB58_9CYAN|nr:peroxiredoxin [Cylindrospermopsis raciborskii]EFA71268.1 Alkyl hydroperoxide reductase/ Thiol specific antioxidant/ Mal allergen [Cylindrospermopsis raciborskii CS-505]MCH4905160.1 redoxin domain-containing protein [Cylindrospermopsis raciborskii CHAB3438]MEB3145303.1 peroxiredoxin [Cylindrospermopsis raciborskii]OBU75675.1 peroxiredoxin [Cylindrospermopsis raciborskii CS-505]PNJ97865.1 peroxiredoxin [Cylindrospermopsis raciborskii C03]
MSIKIGDSAPEFSLTSQNGSTISLRDFRGKKVVVLYFYPKDDTPGCTAESCAFRDQYEVFKTAGAEVIGISGDSRESHQRFATKYNLPFTLLSDPGDQVRKQYGATTAFGFIPGRVTYIIDQNGIVQYVFDSMLNFNGHVQESLKKLQQLSAI